MKTETFTLSAAPLPFSNYRYITKSATGCSIAELLNDSFPAIQNGYCTAHIFINGIKIDTANYDSVYPAANDLVNVRIVPAGGGGGKSPLSMALTVVLGLATGGLGASLGGQLAVGALNSGIGLTAGQGIFLGKVLDFAISTVGKLLISALAPPPKPKNASRVDNLAESSTFFIEGASNQVDPYGLVPINLGVNRVYPKQGARPYTETVGDDQYVRQIFVWGDGDNYLLDDIKIGDTAIANFSDIELEHRLNGNLHEGTNLYSNDVYQDGFNALISQAGGYVLRTSQADIDEIVLDITFDRGLAEFQDNGQRVARSVDFEVQYSVSGASDWSAPAASYKAFSQQDLTAPNIAGYDGFGLSRYRKDIVVLDPANGFATYIAGTNIVFAEGLTFLAAPLLPPGKILLATVLVEQDVGIAPSVTYSYTITDNRAASVIADLFENSGDFAVSYVSGSTIRVAAGGLRYNQVTVTKSTTQAFRYSITLKLPANGTYDVRIKRLTADTNSDQILDTAYFTALKSITYTEPVVATGVNGTAARMRASNQFNGAVDQLNGIISTIVPDYDAGTDTWVNRVSSNPASLFRYVCQNTTINPEAVSNDELDIAGLEDWHVYCDERGYTYNYYIDYEATVEDILRDIAAAGAASLDNIDGKYTVAVDKAKDAIIQMVTPANSWNYRGNMQYYDMPHAFRVEFRNASKGYRVDEIIVYDDGYNSGNATKFERLEYLSATNAELAWKHARRHLATVRLRPEQHKFFMDAEHLVATRGDRITFYNDIPLIGAGYGRVISTTNDGTYITTITLDNTVELATGNNYEVRIRNGDGTFDTYSIVTSGSITATITLAENVLIADAPSGNSLAGVYIIGEELDLVITEIRYQDDWNAEITAVDYSPAIFTAETGTIPPFVSKIVTPFALSLPSAPVLAGQIQSDENVMVLNSDGSYSTRMVIPLENRNDFDVTPFVKVKQSGDSAYEPAEILVAESNRVVITGLQDGNYYDLQIFYRNIAKANLFSLPLTINGQLFEGASALPDDVTNFKQSINNDTITLSWDANTNIDFASYEIRYGNIYSGATWETLQPLSFNLKSNTANFPFVGGTYMIKAVDVLGNKSSNAAQIITYNPSDLRNVVETLTEHSAFAGSKTNVFVEDGKLKLLDTISDGIYYFDNDIDLGAVYTNYITPAVVANGTFVNNLFDSPDLFAEVDLFGFGGVNLFAEPDLFALTDMFGIDTNDWAISLQMRTTQDDPTGSPTWSAWEAVSAGYAQFWAAEFRIVLYSYANTISPEITTLQVTIDMPDRQIKVNGASVSDSTGLVVTYSGAFKADPVVAVTLQNGADGDYYDFTTKKDETGFTLFVKDKAGNNVARVVDYAVFGYGNVEA